VLYLATRTSHAQHRESGNDLRKQLRRERLQLDVVRMHVHETAHRLGYSRAIMLVHEFITDQTNDEYHRRNAADLEAFVRRLSHGAVANVEAAQIYGPSFLSLHVSAAPADLGTAAARSAG
jgi:hypothetical protein